MFDWLFNWLGDHKTLMWSLGAVSVAMFIASLFVMPAVIVRISPDYFAHEQRPPARWAHRTPAVRIVLHIIKTLLGAVLLVAGLAMLVLPGQGLLTIAIGFFLLDFPGKYRFERWMVSRPWIHRPLNWLRHRAGRQPLIVGR